MDRNAPVSCLLLPALLSAQSDDRAARLRDALQDRVAAGWIYEDVDAGYAAARESGKPLLVAFR